MRIEPRIAGLSFVYAASVGGLFLFDGDIRRIARAFHKTKPARQ
jgi:hypothetical protein